MPKSTRDLIKRKHDQIQTHVDTILDYLNDLHTIYSKDHPDYAKGYENLIMITLQLKEFVDSMRNHV